MPSAANPEAGGSSPWGGSAYGSSSWGNQATGPQAWGNQAQGGHPSWQNQGSGSQWQGPGWGAPPFWHPDGMSRPMGIAFMVLGFILWWPIGLALLFYMIWSGRMGCRSRRNPAAYEAGWQAGGWGGPFGMFRNWCNAGTQAGPTRAAPTSGNRAFDEYRAETLRRLEEEQKEFGSFLDRLRFAKDKAEFDEFMAERRQRPPQPPAQPEGGQPQA
jgi:hypothetical protein